MDGLMDGAIISVIAISIVIIIGICIIPMFFEEETKKELARIEWEKEKVRKKEEEEQAILEKIKETAKAKKAEAEIEENFNYEKTAIAARFDGVDNRFIRYLIDDISYGDDREVVERNFRRLGLEAIEKREGNTPITFSHSFRRYANKYYDSYICSNEPIMRDYKLNPYDKGYYIMVGFKEGKVSSIRVYT